MRNHPGPSFRIWPYKGMIKCNNTQPLNRDGTQCYIFRQSTPKLGHNHPTNRFHHLRPRRHCRSVPGRAAGLLTVASELKDSISPVSSCFIKSSDEIHHHNVPNALMQVAVGSYSQPEMVALQRCRSVGEGRAHSS